MTFFYRIVTAAIVVCTFSVAGIAQQSAPPASAAPAPAAQTQSAQQPQKDVPPAYKAGVPQQPPGNAPSEQKTGKEIFKERGAPAYAGPVP